MNSIRPTRPALAAVILAFAFVPVAAIAHPGAPGAHEHAKAAPAASRPIPPSSSEAITAKVTSKTMQGEIVDPQCWIQHDGRGKAHSGCALACAKAGQTLAFLDDRTGTLYQLLAENHSSDPNEKWYGLVGKPVIVKGDVMARGGMNAIILRTAVVDRAGKQRP